MSGEENKKKLLWNGAAALPNEQRIHKLLKSYYINTCRKLAKNSLQVPKEKFSISQMCPYCGSFWNNTEYGLKLIPKQIKSNSKAKRLIENLDSKSKVMNKSNRNRAKWLKKRTSNHLAIKCYQCQRGSLIKIENSNCESREEQANLKSICKEIPKIDSKNVPKACDQKFKDICTFKNNQGIKNLTNPPSKRQKVKQEKKPIKISASKNKKNRNISSNDGISKTQKQNSLLHLAALLQKQPKANLKISSQNKLQAFLK